MRKNNSESGRTLLEIMGVLALIGALTVGSIKYYRWSALKLRANDIMENVYKRTATRDGSAHSKNILENELQTSYHYGIRVPSLNCKNKWMIPVGQIKPNDSPITPDLCKMLVSQLSGNEAFKSVHAHGSCDEITLKNMEEICTQVKTLDIEVGLKFERTKRPIIKAPVVPLPEPTPTPGCTPVASESECAPNQYVNSADSCCKDCPIPAMRDPADMHSCIYCATTPAGQCCNPSNGHLTAYNDKCQECDTSTGTVTDKPVAKCKVCNPTTGAEEDLAVADKCKICDPTTGDVVDKVMPTCSRCNPLTGDPVQDTTLPGCDLCVGKVWTPCQECDPATGNIVNRIVPNCKECDPTTGDFVDVAVPNCKVCNATTGAIEDLVVTENCKMCNSATGEIVDKPVPNCKVCNPTTGEEEDLVVTENCKVCDPATGEIVDKPMPNCKQCNPDTGEEEDLVVTENCKVCDPATGKLVAKPMPNCKQCNPDTGEEEDLVVTEKCKVCDPATGKLVDDKEKPECSSDCARQWFVAAEQLGINGDKCTVEEDTLTCKSTLSFSNKKIDLSSCHLKNTNVDIKDNSSISLASASGKIKLQATKSEIKVLGNVVTEGTQTGLYTHENATIEVSGYLQTNGTQSGAYARSGTITISGHVKTNGTQSGVYTRKGGKMNVGSYVVTEGIQTGVYSYDAGSHTKISGYVQTKGTQSGAYARSSGYTEILGNVSASGQQASVSANGGGNVKISGSVTIFCSDPDIQCSVSAYANNSTVTIGGNVQTTGGQSGVYATNSGKVNVSGSITARGGRYRGRSMDAGISVYNNGLIRARSATVNGHNANSCLNTGQRYCS